MNDAWCQALLRCTEGLYIIEEESRRVVWVSESLANGLGADCVGEPCWRAFLGRSAPCDFCPALVEGADVYTWEYCDPRYTHWVKVKQLLFRHDGVLYRAGNINDVDDMMRLNYETVQEISFLQSDLKQQEGQMAELESAIGCDTLTGLYNRSCFHLDLAHSELANAGLGVLYMDINNLKETNDHHLHEAGDELLRGLAQAMARAARQTEGAKCYRVGGDEFVLLLTGCTPESLALCARRLQEALAQYNQTHPLPCIVAIGQAFSPVSCDPNALVARADGDMYRVKQEMKRTQPQAAGRPKAGE